MYTIVNNLPSIIDDAEKFVRENDRDLYADFFNVCEQYCVKNNVVIGGEIANNILLDAPRPLNNFPYELYAENAVERARELAEQLYGSAKAPHVDKETIYVETNLKHKEFSIWINTRLLFKFYQLPKYRGVSLRSLVKTVKKRGYHVDDVNIMGGEFQLIEVYRKLYRPYAEGEERRTYTELLAAEKRLYDIVGAGADTGAEANGGIGADTGAGTGTEADAGTGADGGAEQTMRRRVEKKIIEEYLPGSDNIIIGDYAIAHYSGREPAPDSRIQFISSGEIDNIVGELGKLLSGVKLTYVIYPLHLPKDFQILKYTIYITDGKSSYTPVVDVFNSTKFEVMPWSKSPSKIKIGGPFVLLRFKFIDLWTLRLIEALGSRDNPNIQRVRNQVDELRGLVADFSPEELFPLSRYSGKYILEDVAKKKLAASEEKFKRYYPALRIK